MPGLRRAHRDTQATRHSMHRLFESLHGSKLSARAVPKVEPLGRTGRHCALASHDDGRVTALGTCETVDPHAAWHSDTLRGWLRDRFRVDQSPTLGRGLAAKVRSQPTVRLCLLFAPPLPRLERKRRGHRIRCSLLDRAANNLPTSLLYRRGPTRLQVDPCGPGFTPVSREKAHSKTVKRREALRGFESPPLRHLRRRRGSARSPQSCVPSTVRASTARDLPRG